MKTLTSAQQAALPIGEQAIALLLRAAANLDATCRTDDGDAVRKAIREIEYNHSAGRLGEDEPSETTDKYICFECRVEYFGAPSLQIDDRKLCPTCAKDQYS